MRSSSLRPDFWVHLRELFTPRGGMRPPVMKLWWCNRRICVAAGWLLTIWNFSIMLFWIGDLNQFLVSLFTEFTTTLCYDKKTDTMCYHETPIPKQTCSDSLYFSNFSWQWCLCSIFRKSVDCKKNLKISSQLFAGE